MTRVQVIVEGPTEESFINNLVAPSLWDRQIFVQPFVVGVPGHKGGRVNYARVRKDVVLQLKQQRTTHCTTMFDLYGIEQDFPGIPTPVNFVGAQKAAAIEQAISADVVSNFPDLRADIRFHPYFQVYEFEGLLFSDAAAFGNALGRADLSTQLAYIRNGFATPEDINDGLGSAPSKRIAQLYGSYRKIIDGTIAAQAVGLAAMRGQCPRFNRWMTRLENLPALE